MKKHFIKLMCLALALVTFISLTACGNKQDNDSTQPNATQENQNSNEQNLHLDKLQGEEQEQAIRDAVRNKFGNEISISMTNTTAFVDDNGVEYYQVYVKRGEGQKIQCWVCEDGSIQDLGPDSEINKTVVEYLTTKLSDKFKNFKIFCEIITTRPINNQSTVDAERILTSQFVEIRIRLIADKAKKQDLIPTIRNKLDGSLDFANGVCYIYFVESPNTIQANDFKFPKHDMMFKFGKGGMIVQ